MFKDGCALALTSPFKPEAMGLDSSYLDNTSQLCPVWFCLPFFLNTVVQIRKDIDGTDVCEGVQSPFVNMVRSLTTFLCFPTWGLQNRMPQERDLEGQGVWEVLQGVGRSYRVCGRSYRVCGRSYRVRGEVLQGGTGCVGRSYRVGHEEELNGFF